MRSLSCIFALLLCSEFMSASSMILNPYRYGAAAPASFSEVQQKNYASSAKAMTHDLVFVSGPTANNVLVVCIVGDATATSVASASGAYNLAEASVNNTGTYIYYRIAGASESATVTVTLSSSANCSIAGFEYSGMDGTPLDIVDNAMGDDGSVECGSVGTAFNDELIIAVAGISAGGSPPPANVTAWSNSFVEQANLETTGAEVNVRLGTATRVVTATGTYTTTATLASSSMGWSGVIAAFHIANP